MDRRWVFAAAFFEVEVINVLRVKALDPFGDNQSPVKQLYLLIFLLMSTLSTHLL
jgi:hypothetical protein